MTGHTVGVLRLLPIVLLLSVFAACSGSDIKSANSCGKLEQAWLDAGGFDADATVQLETTERANELAVEGTDDDPRTCALVAFSAFRAMDCQDPDLSLSEDLCVP